MGMSCLDANSFNNSYTLQRDRTARMKLTNYWVFAQQLAGTMVVVPGVRKRGANYRVSMTSQLIPSGATTSQKRPLPNLLAQGFQLVLRNWPCVVWALRRQSGLRPACRCTVCRWLGLVPRPQPRGAEDRRHDRPCLHHRVGVPPPRRPVFFPWSLHTAAWVGLLQCLYSFFFSPAASLCSSLPSHPAFGSAAWWRRLLLALCARRTPGRGHLGDHLGCPACHSGRRCWLALMPSTSDAACSFFRPSASSSFCSSPCFCGSGGIWSRSTSYATPWTANAGSTSLCCRRSVCSSATSSALLAAFCLPG